MNRNPLKISLLLLALAFFGSACEPASTGDDDDSDSNNKAPTASGEYRITSFQVATEQSLELDIDGDGKGDNHLNNALVEVIDFMLAYLEEYVEIPTALEATVKQVLNSVLSVDTINASLNDQLDTEFWLTRLQPPDGNSVTVDSNAYVDFWLGYQEELGSDTYYLDTEMGALDGTYSDETLVVDTYGEVYLNLILTYAAYSFYFPFNLEMARDYHIYNDDALQEAKLAGAISVAYLEDLIDLLIEYVEDYVPGLNLDDLKTDIHAFLEDDDVSDITLPDGTKAISVSFLYDAEAVSIVEY